MAIDDLEHPHAVVLVGGMGTRLRSALPEGTPKPLASVGNRPFLWYLLRQLSEQGIRRVTLATSHLNRAFQEQLKEYGSEEMDIDFSFEQEPRGTAGAILEALPLVETEPFVAMNGDSFTHAPIMDMVKSHRNRAAIATVAIVEVEDAARFGTVIFDEDDSISAFREKTGKPHPGWINAGIYVLSKRAFDPILTVQNSSIETDLFPLCVGRGLFAFRVTSPFIDIGLPQTYARSAEFFREYGYV